MVLNILIVTTSILASTGVCLLAYGYRASLFSDDRATRWFAWSFLLLAASVAMRRTTWDLLLPIAGGELNPAGPNVIFNMIVIASVYAGLRARLLLIPETDRGDWHWYSAWGHPGLLRFRPIRPPEG